jgi:hypothetical protein
VIAGMFGSSGYRSHNLRIFLYIDKAALPSGGNAKVPDIVVTIPKKQSSFKNIQKIEKHIFFILSLICFFYQNLKRKTKNG